MNLSEPDSMRRVLALGARIAFVVPLREPVVTMIRNLTICLAVMTATTCHADVTFLNRITNSFLRPMGIGIGPDGSIYVADLERNRVKKMNDEGDPLTSWSSDVNEPRDVAVDSNGLVYVANRGNNTISVYTDTGGPELTFGASGSGESQFNEPVSIADYVAGDIFVADHSNDRIQRFTIQLRPTFDDDEALFRDAFGESGTGDGLFDGPSGIDVDADGKIYVADRDNHRIEVFNLDGHFDFAFGSFGSGVGQMSSPSGVAVSQTGLIYVADRDNDRVQRFNDEGVFQLAFGETGSDNGEFNDVRDIDVGPTGLIYVVDRLNNRVQRYFDPEAWATGTNEFTDSFDEPTSVGVGSISELGNSFGIHLGVAFDLDEEKALIVGNTVTIATDGELEMSGGSLTASQLTGTGRLHFSRGHLTLQNTSIAIGSATPFEDDFHVGADSSVTTTNADLQIGVVRDGRMMVDGGGTVTNQSGIVGAAAGISGVAEVSGVGSTWTNQSSLTVGQAGQGTLRISDGGTVTSSSAVIGSTQGGPGNVVIDGDDTSWNVSSSLSVAAGSVPSIVAIRQGATLAAQSATIGSTNGRGTIRVEGIGSHATVGQSASIVNGTLAIDDEATVTIGQNLAIGGAATVDVGRGNLSVDGTITHDGRITLRDTWAASMGFDTFVNRGELIGGGSLSGQLQNQSAGEVIVRAGEQLDIDGTGHFNTGLMRLEEGTFATNGTFENRTAGKIFGRGVIEVGSGLTNRGEMTMSGGFTDLRANIVNTGSSAVIVSTGGGTTTFVGNVTNQSGGTIRVSSGSFAVFLGSFNGGTTGGGTSVVEGLLLPANASTLFEGNLELRPAATTSLQLSSTGDPQQLLVGDQADLSGRLELTVAGNGADPTERGNFTSYPIVTTQQGLFGQFDSIEYNNVELDVIFSSADAQRAHVGNGLFRSVEYDEHTATFTNYLARMGDADGDRDVDVADRSLLTMGWTGAGGVSSQWIDGDFDGNGSVDSLDATNQLAVWTGPDNPGGMGNDVTASLVYRADTGDVTLRAPTSDETLLSFALTTDATFATDRLQLPFVDTGSNTDRQSSQIGQADANLAGRVGGFDLGPILPIGLSEAQLTSYFTTARFASDLGTGGEFTLRIVSSESADLNDDGRVDAADVGIMVSNWAQAGTGDLDFDGIVDAADASIMFSYWTGETTVTAVTSVPEPSGMWLPCVGLVAMLMAKRMRAQGNNSPIPD